MFYVSTLFILFGKAACFITARTVAFMSYEIQWFRLWLRPCSNRPTPLWVFFLLWQTHDYSAIHQPAPCLTESIPYTAAPSCPLSARFPDWSVVDTGCQTPYPWLHHSERAELPGVSQENLAGELFSPCCPPLPHAISSPFSHYELHWQEKRWYPSNYQGVSA